MALRGLFAFSQTFIKSSRCFSSNPKFLDVLLDDKTGIATVTMNRPPVNSLNLDFLNEFVTVINNLEKQNISGMILTSFTDKIYSAGLDLTEVYKPNRERFLAFWNGLQDFWPALYNCSFPSAALITGHAPAGGCLLALSCDYRVAVKNTTIGLSETRLGIPIPVWASLNMVNVVGRRNAELALTTGKIYTSEEALQINLVDEIASDKANALDKVQTFFKRFDGVIPYARARTKQGLRARDVQVMEQVREKETEALVNYIMHPNFQNKLEKYLAMMKTKSG